MFVRPACSIGLVAGDVTLMWTDDTNSEIGYLIHPDYLRRGIAAEASGALLDLAFLRGPVITF